MKTSRLKKGIKDKMREICSPDANGIITADNANACLKFIQEELHSTGERNTALMGLWLWCKASQKAQNKIKSKEKAKDDI